MSDQDTLGGALAWVQDNPLAAALFALAFVVFLFSLSVDRRGGR